MVRIDKREKKKEEEEVRSLEEISKNLLGNFKPYIPLKMTNAKSKT
jgi:hypothetical protein